MYSEIRNTISSTGDCQSFWHQSSYANDDNEIKDRWADVTSPISSKESLKSPSQFPFSNNTNKKVYKHVPHKDRPAFVVQKRNARERKRVQEVNFAFNQLRKMLPVIGNRGKRVSKVKTLQIAIDYINALEQLLRQTDAYSHFDIVSNYRYQSDEFTNILQEFDKF